jgi:hypothetical protein
MPDDHRPWKLRPLQDSRRDMNLAPDFVRPIFVRMLAECLVSAA